MSLYSSFCFLPPQFRDLSLPIDCELSCPFVFFSDLFCFLHCSIYKGSYQSYLNYPPQTLLYPSPPPLIPETVSTGIIFAFTYMCIHCLHHIHLLPLSPSPSPSHWCQPLPPPQNLFHPPVLRFCRGQNMKDRIRNMMFC
jgi:hypothetical protein